MCNVKDVEFKQNPPKHEVTRGWPLVNPKTCPGAQLEFHITEIQPEGGALDDVHEKEDHVFYVLSGRAKAKVGDDDFDVEPRATRSTCPRARCTTSASRAARSSASRSSSRRPATSGAESSGGT